jgi:hypothetical protein
MMARRILAFLLILIDASIFIGVCILLRYAMEASRFYTPDAPQWAIERYFFFGIAGACIYLLLGLGAHLYAIRTPPPAARIPLRTAANCLVIFLLVLYASARYDSYFDAGELISLRTILYALTAVYFSTTIMHIASVSLLSKPRTKPRIKPHTKRRRP